MSVRLLADTLNIPKTVVHGVFMDELNMQCLSQTGLQIVEGRTKCQLSVDREWTENMRGNWTWLFKQCYNRKWNVDIWVRPRDEAPEYRMAYLGVAEAKEIKDEQIQSEDNVNCLFCHQMCGVQKICTTRTGHQRCLLRWCLRKTEERDNPRMKRHCSYLGAASRQNAEPHVFACPWVLSNAQRGNVPAATIQF